MLKELGNAQKQRIGGLAQLTVRVKPSQKARKARNPATNKESTIAAKPASPHASADEGHGRAAKRAESPPTTGRANGLTQPWALINGVSFRQLPEHAMVSDDADPAAVPQAQLMAAFENQSWTSESFGRIICSAVPLLPRARPESGLISRRFRGVLT
jgi:hypothetical protein